MLTQTTITAIRTLVYVGRQAGSETFSIRQVADHLGESPTYLAKVTRHLVRAGILKAHRGVMGGIELNRPPQTITLLAIVEACQGAILGDFCQETRTLNGVCAFHAAAAELHQSIVRVLVRWTLDQFIDHPGASGRSRTLPCLLDPRPAGPTKPVGKRSRRQSIS